MRDTCRYSLSKAIPVLNAGGVDPLALALDRGIGDVEAIDLPSKL
jgi:hypothetical protein